MTAKQSAKKINQQFKEMVSLATEFRGEWTLEVSDAAQIAEVCQFARESLDFDFLVDLTTIDNGDDVPRWTVVYHLYGYGHGCHLRLKTNVSEEASELPSVSSVWRTADWHEREAYDMMGIRFAGHPDLRRILMWEGYPYYPLRKDFPLAGKPSEMPDVAFSDPAPLEGGPFVTVAGGVDSTAREPRVRNPEG
ncbi:MAG: NADH-quinone oxidoreductase subunit C [Verrucomicrobiota bacterium]|jgi:NADH-quinone oxidoreductase subunit C|nr:NADH-quinone oxidoreductase subunit C [Verrucomicrobiota bacterium]MDP7013647.1 NADH-quinone oxidoreductase subunit C [Verrucomicrobiota bacterium]